MGDLRVRRLRPIRPLDESHGDDRDRHLALPKHDPQRDQSRQATAAARSQRLPGQMLGINLGVPAPMAFFPFGGWKSSIYGDLYAQADAVAFYTRKKVITERWFGAEAPKDGWA